MITTYQNKGSLIIEHLLSLLFILLFIFILYININSFNISRLKISDSRSITNTLRVLDSINEKISNSKTKKLIANRLELDDISIIFDDNSVFVVKNIGGNKFKMIENKKIRLELHKNLLVIRVGDIYKLVSIR
ncbi:hypothetical protein [Oceanivirga miroungae]|uniref:Uncharacterized protein n=1 Tax=Oceanivirga miroungae TaxID=1130046 RepID=A0A6I8MB12_9FUSO|nr:hypothetical protein [Oceanivirga miroungae]VWL85449.1 hypothetical protein OMES3154_00734 [Oceanivirga miroungae]